MKLNEMTAHALHQLLLRKEIKAQEIVEAVYQRISQTEQKVNAYLTLTRDQAINAAKDTDRRLAKGEEIAPLAGIPLAVKDNICTEGLLTTCASKMLYNFIPPYNAAVVDRFRQEGLAMVGKTNMDEFAMGSSTENSRFFVTRNPWNVQYVPGGSSGGSAAAVASDQAIVALGSDTGGSIRQPASYCGLVGMKPTYGSVSRYGLIAFASSLDQIGTFSKDVTDCAWLLNVITGYDKRDSTSVNRQYPDYRQYLKGDVKGLRIGIPQEYLSDAVSSGVKQALARAIRVFEQQGAICDEATLPHTDAALPVYYIIAPAEASSNLARYDGVGFGYRAKDAENIVELYCQSRSEGFGEEVKRRIMLGNYALSAGYYDAYYLKALKVRTLIRQDFINAFEKFDVLLTPTAPGTAFKIGEKCEDPLQMYLSDICTISVNLAGIPAVSVPAGFVDGLPVGIQLMGRHFDESTLLNAAYAFENQTDFHLVKPNLC